MCVWGGGGVVMCVGVEGGGGGVGEEVCEANF